MKNQSVKYNDKWGKHQNFGGDEGNKVIDVIEIRLIEKRIGRRLSPIDIELIRHGLPALEINETGDVEYLNVNRYSLPFDLVIPWLDCASEGVKAECDERGIEQTPENEILFLPDSGISRHILGWSGGYVCV